FIQELESLAKPIHAGITNDKEALSLNYLPSLKFDYAQNEAARLEEIMSILSDNMQREKERGISLFGPHRDDISFDVNGMDAQTYGSQGQQRTTA
ncbi:DNA replication and repair protein RecF, partial [Escherichia coli]|nr:DNA replication and repair protein RecF [Escherichia coli]